MYLGSPRRRREKIECTTAPQSHIPRILALSLVRGESLYNRLAREKVAKARREAEEEGEEEKEEEEEEEGR